MRVESTGERLSIEQRERAVVAAIGTRLVQITQQLVALGKYAASNHCMAAIRELRESPHAREQRQSNRE